MHIAVLDDNIADRKQLERLLDRESDRRIQTTGNLYIDSYGSKGSLLFAPLKQYDFIMIDMKESVHESLEIIKSLREKGVTIPICLMRNESEVEGIEGVPEDLFYIEKPIKVAELTSLMDGVITAKNELEAFEKREKELEELEEFAENHKALVAFDKFVRKIF